MYAIAAVEESPVGGAAAVVANEKEVPAADATVAAFARYAAHVEPRSCSSFLPAGAPRGEEEDVTAWGVGAHRS